MCLHFPSSKGEVIKTESDCQSDHYPRGRRRRRRRKRRKKKEEDGRRETGKKATEQEKGEEAGRERWIKEERKEGEIRVAGWADCRNQSWEGLTLLLYPVIIC